MTACTFIGPVKAHRLHHNLDRNPTAVRSTLGARTLSYIEDGQMKATPQILDRIHKAIDSLAADKPGEGG